MDTIISRQETLSLPARGPVNLLHFHQGMVLLIGADAVGLYRDRRAVEDPLANGLVGLRSGAAMFIRPDGVALYASSLDALHNRDCQWVIPFPPLNS